jgi:hypothetical protein
LEETREFLVIDSFFAPMFMLQAIRLGANVLGSSALSFRLGLLDHVASGASLESYGLIGQRARETLQHQPEIKLLVSALRLYLQKNGLRLKDSKVSNKA